MCHTSGRRNLLDPEHCLVVLLAGLIYHTGTQYMDFFEVVSASFDLSIYFILVHAELPSCIVVTLS